MTHRPIRRTTYILVTLVVGALFLILARGFLVTDDVPLPFGYETQSALRGQVTQIGVKDSIAVKKVTFPTGTDSESLAMDTLYLVVVPSDVSTVSMDRALAVEGIHSVNYFGYKYTTPDATVEKAHRADALLTDRFPGEFFVSAKARVEDVNHGNAIANFETDNGITMRPTDGTVGSSMLTPNSLYFIVVNEATPATFTARAAIICGDAMRDEYGVDGVQGTTDDELCDDGNTASGDGCSTACKVEGGFSCNLASPTLCVPYACVDTDNGVNYSVAGTKTEMVHASPVDTVDQCAVSDAVGAYTAVESCAGDNCYVMELACPVHGAFDPVARCMGGCNYGACIGALSCGDGMIFDGEECDDGDSQNGDGCSSLCTVESGFQCAGVPSVCTATPVCGNMNVEPPEICDDGNNVDTDMCTNVCQPAVCGDGHRQAQNNEQCDDGNDIDTDDCSNQCQLTVPMPGI